MVVTSHNLSLGVYGHAVYVDQLCTWQIGYYESLDNRQYYNNYALEQLGMAEVKRWFELVDQNTLIT